MFRYLDHFKNICLFTYYMQYILDVYNDHMLSRRKENSLKQDKSQN